MSVAACADRMRACSPSTRPPPRRSAAPSRTGASWPAWLSDRLGCLSCLKQDPCALHALCGFLVFASQPRNQCLGRLYGLDGADTLSRTTPRGLSASSTPPLRGRGPTPARPRGRRVRAGRRRPPRQPRPRPYRSGRDRRCDPAPPQALRARGPDPAPGQGRVALTRSAPRRRSGARQAIPAATNSASPGSGRRGAPSRRLARPECSARARRGRPSARGCCPRPCRWPLCHLGATVACVPAWSWVLSRSVAMMPSPCGVGAPAGRPRRDSSRARAMRSRSDAAVSLCATSAAPPLRPGGPARPATPGDAPRARPAGASSASG